MGMKSGQQFKDNNLADASLRIYRCGSGSENLV